MRLKIFLLFLFSLSLLLAPDPLLAADPKPTIRDTSYSAKFVSQSEADPIVIEAGASKTVSIRFKNTGTATWTATGKNFVSAYTVEPNYRESLFRGTNWLGKSQTARIKSETKAGAVATLDLMLTAPAKTGDYVERFYLASENNTWIQGSYFFLKIQVVEKKTPVVTVPVVSPAPTIAPTSSLPTASLILQSKKTVSVPGGEKITLILAYENTGTPWNQYRLRASEPASVAATGVQLTFADSNWKSATVVDEFTETAQSGAIVRRTVTFRAPRHQGTYVANFSLETDGKPVAGSSVKVNVTVTSDAPDHYQEPVFAGSPSETAPTLSYRLATEPYIRAGVWKLDKKYVLFVSTEDDYSIFDGTSQVGVLPKGRQATIKYTGGEYSLRAGDISVKSKQFIRLMPSSNPHAVFALPNYDHQVTWKGNRNFNEYRGGMELRKVDGKEDLYVINELLFEDYVKGISENSNSAPEEYLKAQSIAQRTYAYYIMEHSDKHDKRHFDVMSTTADQLYLGYQSEMIMPRFVAAAVATRGMMATYDVDNNPTTAKQVIITPYFANTDGRTRAWTEVWGGSVKPWLVSVKAGYDKGKRLFGHGVGMSQLDAANRAESEGLSAVDLVKYYYTGVEVEAIYR